MPAAGPSSRPRRERLVYFKPCPSGLGWVRFQSRYTNHAVQIMIAIDLHPNDEDLWAITEESHVGDAENLLRPHFFERPIEEILHARDRSEGKSVQAYLQ